MVQRMSVKLALLIAVLVFMGTAVNATAATDPMSVPSVQEQIGKFNQYRNNIFIPGMKDARAYMPIMKKQRPLEPLMEAKMKPIVKPIIIQNIQNDPSPQANILQPPPFSDYVKANELKAKAQDPNVPKLWE